MKSRKEMASLAVAALLAVRSNQVVAETRGDCGFCENDAQSPTSENAKDVTNKDLARQKLVDSLKSMKSNPEGIEFHSAMCYKMALAPDTVEYSCPDCGSKSIHQYHSTAGKLSRQIASVRRSLPNLPVKISVNETALCQKCSKASDAELIFTSECGKCQASFSWKISSDEELDKLDWLFLDYPVKTLDIGPGRGKTIDPDRVKAMVEFVSGCTFCPKCIAELQLNYPAQE